MARKTILYGFLAIGAYLVLTHVAGTRTALNAAGGNSVNLIKAFQGRRK